MDKQIVIHPYNRILLSNIQGLTTDSNTTKMNLQTVPLIERSPTKTSTYRIKFHLHNILENAKYCLNSVRESRSVFAWGTGGEVENTMGYTQIQIIKKNSWGGWVHALS